MGAVKVRGVSFGDRYPLLHRRLSIRILWVTAAERGIRFHPRLASRSSFQSYTVLPGLFPSNTRIATARMLHLQCTSRLERYPFRTSEAGKASIHDQVGTAALYPLCGNGGDSPCFLVGFRDEGRRTNFSEAAH